MVRRQVPPNAHMRERPIPKEAELMSKAELIVGRTEELRPRAGQRLAVLVPCFNEEAAIAKVVGDFRAALPEAHVYVYDTNRTGRSATAAHASCAPVAAQLNQAE